MAKKFHHTKAKEPIETVLTTRTFALFEGWRKYISFHRHPAHRVRVRFAFLPTEMSNREKILFEYYFELEYHTAYIDNTGTPGKMFWTSLGETEVHEGLGDEVQAYHIISKWTEGSHDV